MIVDYRSPAVPAEIRTDICVVGAGAAGITMACALANSGLHVSLIEAGGFELDGNVQALYDGMSVGQQLASPLGCRLRYFGGTTNQWEGWCAPLQASDLESRPWVAGSGWPLTAQELAPWFALARPICQLGPTGDESKRIPGAPPFDAHKLTTRYWHFSTPTRFGRVYRATLQQSERVAVYLNCNLVGVETNRDATEVRQLRVRTLEGRSGYVRAKAYVMACGGMENARILMLANDHLPAGLGNGSGALGRYFMQHIELSGAQIYCEDGAALTAAFNRKDSSEGSIRAHVAVSPESQRSLGLLNCGFSMIESDPSQGYNALHDIKMGVKLRRMPDNLGDKLWTVAKDLDGVAKHIYRNEVGGAVTKLDLTVYGEQRPNAASRISLTNTRDVFGLPKLQVDWRLTTEDRLSVIRATRLLAEEFGRLRIGRLQLPACLADVDAPWPEYIWSGCHHMGATRMSADPATGVVDPDSRVHGVANLYVAGSSVFPTSGYVPPTLTIVAMALRLANHLRSSCG